MERVKCPKCERMIFKMAVCICGYVLSDSNTVTLNDTLEKVELYIPKEAVKIIEDWFRAFYKANDKLPIEHVTLAKRLNFIYEEEDDESF